jgi:transposase InsO family protein
MQQLRAANAKGALMPSKATVQKFIKFCPYCQKLASKKVALPAPQGSLQVTRPFEELSLDTVGPLTPCNITGFTFCIVAVDSFSRFVFAEAVADTSAESAAQFIHKLAGTFGYPAAFRHDNASQFSGHLVRALLNLAGADNHPSVPYNPGSNGLVERAIKEVMRHVRFAVNERRDHGDWGLMLPLATRIINSTRHASVGRSPAEILLPGFQLEEHMYPLVEPAAVRSGYTEISDTRRREMDEKLIKHLQALQVQAIKNARKYNDVVRHRIQKAAPKETRSFELGAWVVTPWRSGRPSKLSTNWRGPYKVTKKLSGTRYEVEDPADLKKYSRHINELFEYSLGGEEQPEETISMDQMENLVEEIVDHSTNDSRRKSDWDFKVRWKGTAPEDDTWIPYKEAQPLAALEEYVKRNPQLSHLFKR